MGQGGWKEGKWRVVGKEGRGRDWAGNGRLKLGASKPSGLEGGVGGAVASVDGWMDGWIGGKSN